MRITLEGNMQLPLYAFFEPDSEPLPLPLASGINSTQFSLYKKE